MKEKQNDLILIIYSILFNVFGLIFLLSKCDFNLLDYLYAENKLMYSLKLFFIIHLLSLSFFTLLYRLLIFMKNKYIKEKKQNIFFDIAFITLFTLLFSLTFKEELFNYSYKSNNNGVIIYYGENNKPLKAIKNVNDKENLLSIKYTENNIYVYSINNKLVAYSNITYKDDKIIKEEYYEYNKYKGMRKFKTNREELYNEKNKLIKTIYYKDDEVIKTENKNSYCLFNNKYDYKCYKDNEIYKESSFEKSIIKLKENGNVSKYYLNDYNNIDKLKVDNSECTYNFKSMNKECKTTKEKIYLNYYMYASSNINNLYTLFINENLEFN